MLDVHCLCPIIDYRENYLFDTRLKCGSFYDTEKFASLFDTTSNFYSFHDTAVHLTVKCNLKR
jgi:hypothetical protein